MFRINSQWFESFYHYSRPFKDFYAPNISNFKEGMRAAGLDQGNMTKHEAMQAQYFPIEDIEFQHRETTYRRLLGINDFELKFKEEVS